MNKQEIYKPISKSIYTNSHKWIKNYSEFLEKIKNKNWTINKLHKKHNNDLEDIINYFWNAIDPIEYQYYLYFIEWYSLRDLIKKLWEIWITIKDSKSYWNRLKKIYWWKLRKNSETTPRKLNKDIEKKSNLQIEKTKKLVDEILNEKTKNTFSYKKYNSYIFKKDKIKYALYSYWLIEENNNYELKKFIDNTMLENKIWAVRMAQIIEIIINNKIKNWNISIDYSNIYNWNWSKQKKES